MVYHDDRMFQEPVETLHTALLAAGTST